MTTKSWQGNRWLADQADAMTQDLIALCDINSGSDHLDGLKRAADWLEQFFAPLGIPCKKLNLPTYSILDDAGSQTVCATGPALRWDLGNPNAPRCLWTIHYDTVYSQDDQFQTCEPLPKNILRGPGVIDAKGGIVVMRYAAMALKQFIPLEEVGLSLILTPDEEIGSPSSVGMWESIARDFQTAFLFEPTLADGSLVHSRKGTGTFVLVVRGKSAHAGRNFHEGRNAIAHCCRLASEIDQLNGQRPNITVNIGRLRGGNAVNVVPDTAVLRVNVRIADSQDQQWIENHLNQLAQKYDQDQPGYRVEIHGGIHAPAKIYDHATQQIQTSVEKAAADLGLNLTWKQSGGASDGNKLQAMGLPNLDTFGPRGDGLHSPNEWIELDSLVEKAQLTCGSFLHLNTNASPQPNDP